MILYLLLLVPIQKYYRIVSLIILFYLRAMVLMLVVYLLRIRRKNLFEHRIVILVFEFLVNIENIILLTNFYRKTWVI
jgi:hypothetical protein